MYNVFVKFNFLETNQLSWGWCHGGVVYLESVAIFLLLVHWP